MAIGRIAIPLDPQTAKAYRGAPYSEKKKMQVLVRRWRCDLAAEKPATLKHFLDEVSEKAMLRGLTPKILDALLIGV